MNTLSAIRDIYRAVMHFVHNFERTYGLGVNEGMILCTLHKYSHPLSSGELAFALGLKHSHTSKLIRAVERCGYIYRVPGCDDRRQMYFGLTDLGRNWIGRIDCSKIDLPKILRDLPGMGQP